MGNTQKSDLEVILKFFQADTVRVPCIWWQSFSSIQFGHSVVSNSLRSHELQHARPPCSSPTPRVYPNSCPLSRWCHPAISSSVVPFSSCPQSLPASGYFPLSEFFAWGGQSIGVSASPSVLQWISRADFLKDGLVGSLCSPRDSQESSPTPQLKSISSSVLSFLYGPTLTFIHDYWKNHSLTRQTFVSKVMSLLFNMLSRLVITSSKEQASFNFMATVPICSDFWSPPK